MLQSVISVIVGLIASYFISTYGVGVVFDLLPERFYSSGDKGIALVLSLSAAGNVIGAAAGGLIASALSRRRGAVSAVAVGGVSASYSFGMAFLTRGFGLLWLDASSSVLQVVVAVLAGRLGARSRSETQETKLEDRPKLRRFAITTTVLALLFVSLAIFLIKDRLLASVTSVREDWLSISSGGIAALHGAGQDLSGPEVMPGANLILNLPSGRLTVVSHRRFPGKILVTKTGAFYEIPQSTLGQPRPTMIRRIDPIEGKVLHEIDLDGFSPDAAVYCPDAVAFPDDGRLAMLGTRSGRRFVLEIDPVTDAVALNRELHGQEHDLTRLGSDGSAVWVFQYTSSGVFVNPDGGSLTVFRADQNSDKQIVLPRISATARAAAGGGRVWISEVNGASAFYHVLRIFDLASGAALAELTVAPHMPEIAVVKGRLIILAFGEKPGAVSARIVDLSDPKKSIETAIPAGVSLVGSCDGMICAANGRGQITLIDVETGRLIRTIEFTFPRLRFWLQIFLSRLH